MMGGSDKVLVPLRDCVGVGQIGRRGKDHADVINQLSDPAPRFRSGQNIEVRNSGLRGEAGGGRAAGGAMARSTCAPTKAGA